MTTRLYLSSTASSPITPAYSTYWTAIDTLGGRNAAVTSKDGSALSNGETTTPIGSTKTKRLHRQFNIALPNAVTISGTADLVVAGWEVNAADDAGAQCIIRVIASDGTTVLATLFAGDTTTSTATSPRELSVLNSTTDSSGATVRVMSMALSSYSAPAGAYLSIEVGILQVYAGSLTGRSGRLRLGAPSTSDLAATNGAATPNDCPWIEFSTTLLSSGTTVSGNQADETDAAQAGSLIAGTVKAGAQATEADSTQAGTATVGAVVAGTLASEADTAGAGTSTVGAVVTGGLAIEADTVMAGTVGGTTLIGGSIATETDAAQSGTTTVGAVVAGAEAMESDTAQAGAVVSAPPGVEIPLRILDAHLRILTASGSADTIRTQARLRTPTATGQLKIPTTSSEQTTPQATGVIR